MYQVISANRSPKRAPKNWRIFEKESLEKYFGKVIDVNGEDGHSVLDTYLNYKESIKYIRWYPDPELLNKDEYIGLLKQSCEIGNIPYLINSPHGFTNVQSKDEAFKIWGENKINCPTHFTFIDKEEFYSKRICHCLEGEGRGKSGEGGGRGRRGGRKKSREEREEGGGKKKEREGRREEGGKRGGRGEEKRKGKEKEGQVRENR